MSVSSEALLSKKWVGKSTFLYGVPTKQFQKAVAGVSIKASNFSLYGLPEVSDLITALFQCFLHEPRVADANHSAQQAVDEAAVCKQL